MGNVAHRAGGWVVMAWVAALAACGGGGGGGSASPPPSTGGGDGNVDTSFSVTFDRSSVSAAWDYGQAAVASVVRAQGSGTPGGNVFVGANTPSGQPDPQIQQVDVQVDLATSSAVLTVRPTPTLAPGSYSGRLLLLACPDNVCTRTFSGTPFALDYSFIVSVPAVQVADGAPLVVGSDTDLATLAGSTPVTLAGGGSAAALTWTATTSTPWLRLVKSTGSVGESVTYQVDRTALAALAGWQDHVGTIDIRVPGAPNVPQVHVTLRKELAELAFAGPGRIAAGSPATVLLGGRGLDRLAVPRVAASGGAAPTSVSLRGTRALAVQLPALPAGRYTFAIDNTLGVATSQAVLDVVSANPLPQLPLKAAATGTPRTLVYDEVTRTAYVADVAPPSRVRRYRASGTTWQADELLISGLLDIGLTPTADRLVVATSQGVSIVDTASFTVTGTTAAPQALTLRSPTGHGLAVMHDGSVWLATGIQASSRALVYSLLDGSFTEPLGNFSIYDGPWFLASRNRERLLAVQTSSLSPPPLQPLALVTDASEGTLRPNGVGITFFNDAHLSDDGGRLAIGDTGEVWDGTFGLVGRLPAAQAGLAAARVVVSPNGRWVYRLLLRGGGGGTPANDLAVEAFDSSAPAATLPVRGQLGFSADTVCGNTTQFECYSGPLTITPDGQHLLWAGPAGFMSVALPSGLVTPAAARQQPAMAPRWLRELR